MTIVIIEDESLNAEQLLFYIEKYDSSITVATVLKSNEEILAWFTEHKMPDLVFCDIKLLDGNVFTSLQRDIITCPIIFTTAFNDFYQEAFDSNGIAYLLKPISYKSFEAAMSKFNRLASKNQPIDWASISSAISKINHRYKERILVKANANTLLLEVKNIVSISTHLGICHAVDNKGKTYEFRQRFADLAEKLNPNIFFKINRGEMVNINFIESIEPYFNDRISIKLINQSQRLTTSTATTAEFRKWIEG
ncbi:LytR/AlgR family response regulator transcription factor [Pedobacter nanyangensis]|uniref:LytR/AlgR family response regulator transcription factor n=1 Tax=Pedobacter nanyangensis TaxID=1562389 RepID=UPI000DE3ED10|nr:LytTR family DNA-binding domain-containing protein [Pedobacter nanyangensis]